MKMMYISQLCSRKKLEIIRESIKNEVVITQAQKFNRLIIEGLLQRNMQISSISTISTHSRYAKRLIWKGDSDEDYGVKFYYLTQIFFPIIRIIVSFFGVFVCLLSWVMKNRHDDKIILCDILNIYYLIPAIIAAKITGTEIIGLVTDLPRHLVGATVNVNIYKKIIRTVFIRISDFFASKCDGYITLTKDLNTYINRRGTPFIIIEGVVDSKMKYRTNMPENKYPGKVIMFAGMLDDKFGTKKLIDAFKLVKNRNSKLHLYGTGDTLSYINECVLSDNRIFYGGLLPNDEIVEREIISTLLVNPRPTDAQYVKYSFPSKNMEYMASGTPILTTRLPGMPEEYYDYCYFLDDESIQGMAQTIETLLSKTNTELYEFGKKAKEFVLTKKNNIIQAEKISELINRVFNCKVKYIKGSMQS